MWNANRLYVVCFRHIEDESSLGRTARRGARAPRTMGAGDLVVVSATCGSDGDARPCAMLADALGEVLRETRVVFMSNPTLERECARAEFVGVGDGDEYEAMRRDHGGRGRDGGAIVRFWMSIWEEHARKLEKLISSSRGRIIIMAHTLDLAVRCIEEREIRERGVRSRVECFSVVLSPALVRKPDLKIPPYLYETVSCIRPRRLAVWFAHRLVDAAFVPRLNQFRAASMGSNDPVRGGVFEDWFLCRRGAFAMYPEMFAQAPEGFHQVCFPLASPDVDESSCEAVRKVRRFIDRADSPTIVFVSASGNPPFAAKYFKAAAKAMRALGSCAQAVFLTRHADRLPPLPNNSIHIPFLPLEACAGIHIDLFVSHGTIGCLAHALRFGWPQLVVPAAWDQPFHAALLRSITNARALPMKCLTWRRLRRVMEEILDDEVALVEARRIAKKLEADSASITDVAVVIAGRLNEPICDLN